MTAEAIRFSFDGRSLTARPGQSVAAALTEAGQRVFRQTAKGASRGMFCGMGVCQDCLVTVDGAPNQRACVTLATEGATVLTQVALARLAVVPATPAKPAARQIAPDVLVIGGGAGGLNAAIAAAEAGASVVLVDERKVPGGQYFKQPSGGAPMLDAQQTEGAALISQARASGAEVLGGVEIWGAFDGPLFLAEHQGGALIARPRSVIVATGAYERPHMVPGWTLPGVMTTGAAQTLWRSYRTLPGKRVAVCGSGPLNLQVALELAEGGATVALVAEAAPALTTRPGAALALVVADPKLALKGARFLAALRRRGVPVQNRLELVKVDPEGDALRATFRDERGHESEVVVDALCMNDGFEPQNEALRLLGARMQLDPVFGHLRCTRSSVLETTVPGVFAVGDCAGMGGAPAAAVEGQIAGRAAAALAGHRPIGDIGGLHSELARHRRFQSRLWSLHRPAPRTLANTPDDTILCRCEEITLGEVRAGLKDGPDHVGTLKRLTRVGMGRCQGRYCGAAAARLVAETTGQPINDHSHFAPRVPIKPVSIATILAAQEALDGQP
ncbi:2Fe-2S iron-sulfur cluster-binding protein [Tabrizicola sp. BL-A-41-H6]|uniref:2Fe-2S iron-sulfur cluster-binding protein n=1 Tax=Tabrizicola sp. BL-A-41-H6 TaxID=3421107 RepID=UPI003D66B49C